MALHDYEDDLGMHGRAGPWAGLAVFLLTLGAVYWGLELHYNVEYGLDQSTMGDMQ